MAGAIPNLTATGAAYLAWQAYKIDEVLGTRASNSSIGLSMIFQSTTGATLPATQIKAKQIEVPAGTSVIVDLTDADENVLENPLATFVSLNVAVAWLPTTTQSALGTAATSVTIGKAASTPALAFGLADSDSGLLVKSGECHMWATDREEGYALSSSAKHLQIINNDADTDAVVILGLLGMDSE